jgi:hypothetical protein
MFESLLLIVVVVELVWILSSIFRGTEDDRKGQQRPPLTPRAPGASGPPRTQRPPATTVDRFLEEINRRRREAAERQTPAGQIRPQVPVPGRPRSLEPRPEPPRRQPRPAPAVVTPPLARPPAPGRLPAEVVVTEVQYPQVEEIEARRPRPAVKPASSPAASPPEKVVAAEVIEVRPRPDKAATRQTRPAPARAAQLMAMLQNRQTLRNALVLNEILAPPLCERGG